MWYVINSNELYHHGIKGQKWGVRRFQNKDGSLTAEGIKRYGEQFGDTKLTWKDYRREKTQERLKLRDKHPEYSRGEEARIAINNLGKKYGHLRVRELRKSHWIKTGAAIASAYLAVNAAASVASVHSFNNFERESLENFNSFLN